MKIIEIKNELLNLLKNDSKSALISDTMWHHVTPKCHTFELLLHQRGVLVEHASHTNSINVYDQRPNRKKSPIAQHAESQLPKKLSYLNL